MGRPHRSPSYPRRIPGIPILGKFRVRQLVRPYPPPLVDPTDFSSDLYGGFGATTTVDYWPGESDPIETRFSPDNDLLRAPARSRLTGRRGSTPASEQAVVPQAVSNRRRAEVSGIGGGVPSGAPIPGSGSAVPLATSGGDAGATFSSFESDGPVPDDSFVPEPTVFTRMPVVFNAPAPSAPVNEPTREGLRSFFGISVPTRREAGVPPGFHLNHLGEVVPNIGERRAADVSPGFHLNLAGEIVPNLGERRAAAVPPGHHINKAGEIVANLGRRLKEGS